MGKIGILHFRTSFNKLIPSFIFALDQPSGTLFLKKKIGLSLQISTTIRSEVTVQAKE